MAGTTIEQAKATFPMVEDDVLERIFARSDEPTLAYVADILERAAERGKVPDEDYMDLAAEAVLNNVDDSELPGVEKEDVLRGMEANRQAQSSKHKERAIEIANNGSLEEVVQAYNDVAALASNSLAAPEANSIPQSVNDASIILSNEIAERIDAMADEGDTERMKQAQGALGDIEEEALRDAMFEKLNNAYALVTNDGSEYEQVKQALLDEENTPAEVQQMVEEIKGAHYDVTWTQAKELVAEATDWLDQYRELAQQAEAEAGAEG